MDEFLIPSPYTGDGFGIAVSFGGLAADRYDGLALSLDGIQFFEVEQNAAEPFYSALCSFDGLNCNEVYCVTGRVSSGGAQYLVSCLMPAAARASVRMERAVAVCAGGGMSAHVSPPVGKGR